MNLNWLEIACLYIYADKLPKKQLQPFLTKIKNIFKKNEAEALVIVTLAKNSGELRELLMREVPYIKHFHHFMDLEYYTKEENFQKLNQENQYIVMQYQRNVVSKSDFRPAKIHHLVQYHILAKLMGYGDAMEETRNNLKPLLANEEVSLYDMRDIYEVIPFSSFADIWYEKLKTSCDINDIMTAARLTGEDRFFDLITNNRAINQPMSGEHVEYLVKCYKEENDERIISILCTFFKTPPPIAFFYVIETYRVCRHERLRSIVKKNIDCFENAMEAYKIEPHPDFLRKMKKYCKNLNEARSGFLVSKDEYFFVTLMKFLKEDVYGYEDVLGIYEKLCQEGPISLTQRLRSFIQQNLPRFWLDGRETKKKLMEILQ
jgi:hypothetical protein